MFIVSLCSLQYVCVYDFIYVILFYGLFYFRYLIEYVFIVSLCSLQCICVYGSIYSLSFHSHINLDQLYHINLLFDCFLVHVHDKVRV